MVHSGAAASGFDDPDRTARARIRDAAIARFAADGVAATSLKRIAADAGVSPPLVIHHFGSKEGLRVACDEHVAAQIRARKHAAMSAGANLDPFAAVRDAYGGIPLLGYLARTVMDDSPHVNRFIDEMVDDAVDYMQVGIRNGVLKPTDRIRDTAVVLTLWQLGALVLHEHARRLLGIDLSDPEGAIAWALASSDILSKGVLVEDVVEKWRDAGPQPTKSDEGQPEAAS